MKTILSLFLSCMAMGAAAQFTWSNPQPSGHTNTKVVFTDASNGYIMNIDGDLLSTVNSGATWQPLRNFRRCKTMDVKDSFMVIGGGDTTVYISTDRAQTWKKGIIRQEHAIEQLQIISKDTVFALCKNNNISTSELYRSSDGGQTWQLMNGAFIIKALDFINSEVGYATSFGGIFKTVDGGLTWLPIFDIPGGYAFISIKFFDQNIGYAYKDLDGVVKTTDGGATWNVCLPSSYGRVYNITFANASTVFLTGEYGGIYRSFNGGDTWDFKSNHTGDRYAIYSGHFTSATTGYFVGMRGQIFKTTNAGDSYINYSPTYTDVKPIFFPTPSVGYAGTWTELFKTTDTGRSWSKLPLTLADANYNRFQYLHFFSKDSGLALAETPVQIFQTADGGSSWSPLTLPVLYKDHIKGFFALGNTIYLNLEGGSGTHMLQSKDRGRTWQTQSIFYGKHNFKSIFFTDEKTGYAVQGPYLYKTFDSAKTWSPLTTYNNDSYSLNNIWFSDAATGYVVGAGGFNIRTLDSGKTWARFAITPGNLNFDNVHAIRFFDKKVGYLTSGDGGIYKTIDGGAMWKAEKASPGASHSLYMTVDTTLFLGGLYGIILKKDMREFSIDSLQATLGSACAVNITANVSAVLSQVDSIWFEYGTTAFTKKVLAFPSVVKDSTVKCQVVLRDLEANQTYMIRGKIRYRNTDYYSEPRNVHFPGGLPTPTITFNGTLLSSSATAGNQWSFNGTPIAGATGQTLQPTTQGIYTVQQKTTGCTSSLSEGYHYTTTAINDPVLTAELRIFPNPVTTTLWIMNKMTQKLSITLIDSWGRTVHDLRTASVENTIDMRLLPAGLYSLLIEEMTTHKKTSFKIIKL